MIEAINEIWGFDVCEMCEKEGFVSDKYEHDACESEDCERIDDYIIHNKLFPYLKKCWDEVDCSL